MKLEKVTNPVHDVPSDEWKPSDIKCNYAGCQGSCREAPPEKKPKATLTLVNCLNKQHCNGDYGFYVNKAITG